MELAEFIQSPYFDSFPEYLWVTWFNNFNQLSDFIDLENSGWVNCEWKHAGYSSVPENRCGKCDIKY